MRPDNCMYGIHCESADQNGASIIHGNREVFHNEKQPAFKALYQGFRDVSEFYALAKSSYCSVLLHFLKTFSVKVLTDILDV